MFSGRIERDQWLVMSKLDLLKLCMKTCMNFLLLTWKYSPAEYKSCFQLLGSLKHLKTYKKKEFNWHNDQLSIHYSIQFRYMRQQKNKIMRLYVYLSIEDVVLSWVLEKGKCFNQAIAWHFKVISTLPHLRFNVLKKVILLRLYPKILTID